MNIIVCENYEQVSARAAEIIRDEISENPNANLGLATGSTPEGTYRELIRMHREEGLSFQFVSAFNLDEYYPIAPTDPQSYRYFMREKLFSQVDICEENLHIPSGAAEDAAAECAAYDELIRALGGIDLQLLGIGRNGHVGFNEPDEYLIAGTHLTPLTEDTISANSRFFASEEEVPKHALTMGMASILQARKILLLATGESKREAVRALRDDRVTTACPASLLKLHPNVIVLCDKAAYGE